MITLTICGEKPLDSGQLGPTTTAKARSILVDTHPLQQQVIWLRRSGAFPGLPCDQDLALGGGGPGWTNFPDLPVGRFATEQSLGNLGTAHQVSPKRPG